MTRSVPRLCLALLLLGLPAAARAAEASPELADAIHVGEQRVAVQTDRVETLRRQLLATDEMIERRVERVTAQVAAVTDGPSSGVKVTRAKQDLFESLVGNIDRLAAERGRRLGEMLRPHSPEARATLVAEIRWLNERIEKRAEQAMSLVVSLPLEKDTPRTITHVDDGERVRVSNPVYRQEKKVSSRGNQLRDDACDELREAVARLRRNKADLERVAARATAPDLAAFANEQIARNEETVRKHTERIEEARLRANPAARALASGAAEALEDHVADEKVHARRDQAEWVRLKSALETETARLRALQDQLALLRRQSGAAAP